MKPAETLRIEFRHPHDRSRTPSSDPLCPECGNWRVLDHTDTICIFCRMRNPRPLTDAERDQIPF